MRSTLLLSMFSISFATGCVLGPRGPQVGAVKTGEPLAVVDDVRQWTTTYQEKTGETVYKNADGETVGTKEHFRNRTELHQKAIWYPVQGAQQINDEDFFRLTGDDTALTATRDMHSRGKTYAAIGTVGMVAGITAMILGKYVSSSGLQIGLISGGSIVGLAGAYGFYRGYEMLSPDSHAVDRSIGEVDAQRYNQSLGRGASVTILGGKF